VDLLYIDDFGIELMSDQTKRDVLEIIEERYDKRSTLITSKIQVEHSHTYIDAPTLADAILDRLVHNSHRLVLNGASLRKKKRDKAHREILRLALRGPQRRHLVESAGYDSKRRRG